MTVDELLSEIESDAFVRYCSSDYGAFRRMYVVDMDKAITDAIRRAYDSAYCRANRWWDSVGYLPTSR